MANRLDDLLAFADSDAKGAAIVRPHLAAMQAQQARAVPTTATPEAQPPPDPLFLSTLSLRV